MTVVWNARRAAGRLALARGWPAAWGWAVIAVLGLRLALGAVMAGVWLVVRPYLPASIPIDVALTGGRVYSWLAEALLSVWLRWDAVHYLGLALRGYFQVSAGESVFYPLYPLLVAGVSPLAAGDYLLAGLIVSTLAAMVNFAMLYRLTEEAFGPDAARWSIAALALYPTAFFLIAPFTESLFLALTLPAFLAAGARRWWLAGALGALASLVRGPGVLTALALACIAWRHRPPGRLTTLAGIQSQIAPLAGILLPLAGGGVFILWRAAVGFPSVASVLSQYSGVEFIDPLRGLGLAVIQFVRVRDLPTTLDVASALLFAGVLAAMLAQPRWRRVEWLVYLAANLLGFFSKRSVQAASLQSLARYVLALFPAFIVAGDWLSRRGRKVRFVYTLVSSIGLLGLAVSYSLWWFVG